MLIRIKKASILSRDSKIARIQVLATTASLIDNNPDLLPSFLIAASDLDSLWTSFETHNQAVLDALLDLDLASEFSTQLETDIRALYISVVAAVEKHSPSSDTSSSNGKSGNVNGSKRRSTNDVPKPTSSSRLPEIPLPTYSGDLSGWPVFCDRFFALVGNRSDLSNIERFYYLLGCLNGDALYTIRNIAVTENTYDLAWSTSADRYDKPRQLASLILDKLIAVPPQSQESLEDLKNFLILFSDQVATLKALNIPDLGEFILFALSVRGLSMSTRKGFEATNLEDFPMVSDLVSYVKSRVAVLETVTPSSYARCSNQHQDTSK